MSARIDCAPKLTRMKAALILVIHNFDYTSDFEYIATISVTGAGFCDPILHVPRFMVIQAARGNQSYYNVKAEQLQWVFRSVSLSILFTNSQTCIFARYFRKAALLSPFVQFIVSCEKRKSKYRVLFSNVRKALFCCLK